MRRALPACLAALLLTAAACGRQAPSDVIAADGALCDISRRLAGADLGVSCLLGPSDDPHQLQLRPDQSRRIRQARLLLINGYGLTPALERMPQAVRAAELAVPDSPRLAAGGIDPEAEHHHGEARSPSAAARQDARDPHVWHDPRQAAALVVLVSRRLQALSPQGAGAIQARAEAMLASLSALHRWNGAQFATIPPPRTLATGHRAFASLARAYGLEEVAVLDGASASSSLRPRALAEALRQLRERRVRSLFSERLPAGRTLQRISELSGVPIAPRPLPADHGGDDLMATLTANTCLVVVQLGGRCDAAGRERLLRSWQSIR